MLNPFLRWVLVCGCALMAGCAGTTSPLADSLGAILSPKGYRAQLPDNPDPRFTYLRVQATGYPPGLLVLGYVDPQPMGPVWVWYSANGQTLKTQNGRIVGTTGVVVDWPFVQFLQEPPAWTRLPGMADSDGSAVTLPYRFQRVHDLMPGYRSGLQDEVRLVAASMPQKIPPTLPQSVAQSLHWFEEVTSDLPPSVYAVGSYGGAVGVVYSQQCLTRDFCVQMQRWPVRKD